MVRRPRSVCWKKLAQSAARDPRAVPQAQVVFRPVPCQNRPVRVSNSRVDMLATVLHSVDRSAVLAAGAVRNVSDEALLAHEPRIRRLVHRLLGWPLRAAEV